MKAGQFMRDYRNFEKPLEWVLGNLDEAFFSFSNYWVEKSGKPPYLSDKAELDRLYKEFGPVEKLEELFPGPPHPDLKLVHRHSRSLLLQAGPQLRHYRVYNVEYLSAVTTGFKGNDRVYGLYLERPGHETAPVVVYLHGWMEFETGFSLRLPLTWAGPLGFNILALHMPFHFERTPPGKLSGEMAITGNLPLAVKAMGQAVSDVRQAITWLKTQQPDRPTGLIGKSLGGLVGAMVLASEPKLDAGVLAVPATGAKSSIWQSTYTSLIRRDLDRQGLDEAATARLLEVIRPGRYRPAIEARRILVLKANADRVCFPEETDTFAREWGTPLVALPTGHLTATFHPRARQVAQQHLGRFLQS